VRNLNLDDELAEDEDDFGEENPYEDLSEEDQIQLDDSLARLISLIGAPGNESGFTEREMKDALWDTYFDVDQALNGLVEEKSKRESKEKKKAGEYFILFRDDSKLGLFLSLSFSFFAGCV